MDNRLFRILSVCLFVALLGWGGYAVIAYAGVNVHMSVLLEEALQKTVGVGCPETGYFCRGLESIVPSVTHSIGRWFSSPEAGTLSPFFWFTVISILAMAGVWGWHLYRTGEMSMRWTWTPLRVTLLFLALVWLLFTCLGLGDNDGAPFARMFEPVPQIYTSIGTESLEVLQENFQQLKDFGCLKYLGQTDTNAGVYDLKGSCIQVFFVARVLPPFLIILALIFIVLTLGRALLSLVRLPQQSVLLEGVISAGLGTLALAALLWLCAILAIYYSVVGWLIVVAIPILLYRHALYWLKTFIKHRWESMYTWNDIRVCLGWLLLSYLALNFLSVIRPFPIGWDDLGVYMNKPKLLVSYGKFIPQMASFQWEYLTSLGFLLFGYGSAFSTTIAMMINWAAGLFAVMVVFASAHTFLKRGAFLACLLLYTLPLIGHFSFADMKIDNAVFAAGGLAILCALCGLFGAGAAAEEPPPHERLKWLLLAGIIVSAAFAYKITSIMVFFAIGAMILGVTLHWSGFIAGMFLSAYIYGAKGQLKLGELLTKVYGSNPPWEQRTIVNGLLLLGILFLTIAAFSGKKNIYKALQSCGVYIVAFIAVLVPWIGYNNMYTHQWPPGFTVSLANTLTMNIDISGTAAGAPHTRSLPPELAVDVTAPTCSGTSKTEELDRYWGFGTGWSHYLLLPWRTVMNIDSAGYYVTTSPALLLFPLLLLLPAFWTQKSRWLRWLAAGTFFLIIQWVFLANGIPWYGVGMFFGLTIAAAAIVALAPDRWSRWLTGILITISLLFTFAHRHWQFDNMRNLYEYPLGKISAEGMQERTIPYYDDIRDIVLERAKTMPDRPYVFRAGTFIPYFIPRNFELLPVADNQLEMFKCLYQERDAKLTVRRMQALGFNSIIFDTNTHTIERDPNGTLHQKVNKFLEFVNTPGLGLTVKVNSPDHGVIFLLLP